MFGASSLSKSPSDHPVIFPEHTFPQHGLLSRKTEGSDSEIEMPWFGQADEIHPLGHAPQNRMADLSTEAACSAMATQNQRLIKIWKITTLSFQYFPLPKRKKDKHSLSRRWQLALSCLLLTGKEQQTYYYFAMFSPNFIFQPVYAFCRL